MRILLCPHLPLAAAFLAGCASMRTVHSTPASIPSAIAAEPAAAASPDASLAPLRWDERARAVIAGPTGTRIVLARSAALRVTQPDRHTLRIDRDAQQLVVRIGDGPPTAQSVIDDVASWVASVAGENAELHIESARADGPGGELRYVIRASGTRGAGDAWMYLGEIARNRSFLRVAVISQGEDIRPGDPRSIVASIEDNAALDLTPPPPPAWRSNAVWDTLRLLRAVDMFMHPFRYSTPGYAVPPGVSTTQ